MTPDDVPLIERTVELGMLAGAVRRLADGEGGVVVLDAPAGLGKTALLERAALFATDSGCLVRRAAPGPLERHFPFGAVRALLEAPLREASGEERARLLDGAAAAAGTLLLEGAVPGGDSTMLLAHSVLWLCAAIAERRPLALIVDDAQWADRSSLEVLAYLARRIDDLPLLIAVGARADDPRAASDLLSLLGGVRSATVLHPQRLTPRGAAQLIRRLAPEASAVVCRDCHRAVGGNPWLLGELGRQIATHGPDSIAEAGDEAPPVSAIARNVIRWRLATLSARDRAVAAALAVMGDGALPHVVAAVAGVPPAALGPARDALLAAGLLDAEGERLAHGLVAAAIGEDLTRTECERLHREAARALMAGPAEADVVASHLLQCQPQADPDVSELLVRAASTAARRGAPHTAAAYLERALEEHAPGDDRGHMLAQLAMVAFDAGLPDSQRRLLDALPEVRDRESRIDVLTRLAALNVLGNGDADHAELFEHELAGETDPGVRLAVEAASLDALMMIPGRHVERARRVAAIDLTATSDPLLERVDPRAPRMDRRRGRHARRVDLRDAGAARAGRRPAAARGRQTRGLPPVRAGAGDDRPRRGGPAGDRRHARRGHGAGLAAAAPRRGLVRVEPRVALWARRGGREPRPHGPGARRRRPQPVHRRRHHAAAVRAGRARGVRRGPRPAVPCTPSTATVGRRAGRSASVMRERACGWPRETSSAPMPRPVTRARCASSRDGTTRAGRRGARPPPWRSPTSAAARRPPSWRMPRWRSPSASGHRCRSRTLCTRGPSRRPTRPRA